MEKVKRDKHRVAVSKPPSLERAGGSAAAQAARTGYIVKIDKSTGSRSHRTETA